MSGFKEPSFADRQRRRRRQEEHSGEVPRQAGSTIPRPAATGRARGAGRRAAKAKLAREAAKAEQKAREARPRQRPQPSWCAKRKRPPPREFALEAERKAARDARYAARKKRK